MSFKKISILFAASMFLGLGFMYWLSNSSGTEQAVAIRSYVSISDVSSKLLEFLRPEIEKSQVFFVGLDPYEPSHAQVLLEFLRIAKLAGLNFNFIVMDESLGLSKSKDLIAIESQSFTFRKELDRFWGGLELARDKKLKLLVLSSPVESSKFLKDSLINLVNQKYQSNFLSLSMVKFPRNQAEESEMSIPCLMGAADQFGVGELGCAIIQKSRTFYRKKYHPAYLLMQMESRPNGDYLMYLRREN
jgi:hypothetical protein